MRVTSLRSGSRSDTRYSSFGGHVFDSRHILFFLRRIWFRRSSVPWATTRRTFFRINFVAYTLYNQLPSRYRNLRRFRCRTEKPSKLFSIVTFPFRIPITRTHQGPGRPELGRIPSGSSFVLAYHQNKSDDPGNPSSPEYKGLRYIF